MIYEDGKKNAAKINLITVFERRCTEEIGQNF